AEVEWVTSPGLVVRASLHTGSADLRMGDYYGPTVNRAARLRAIAHGGQTILSGATYQLVQDQLPDGLSLVDMGDHGLKDLTRPERVYQLDIDDLPSTFPPLLSLGAVPNNLPIQLTEFIGRERELEDVKRLVGENRLVTILASGGSGKSRLAIQAAAELSSAFPHGVFFIELAGFTTGGEIVQALTEALGLGSVTDEDRQTQLLSYLAGKRQLLVFDNFEHLRGEAKLVTEILRAAPEVKIIATSREKLNLTGEVVFSLSGLNISWDTSSDAITTSAVRLFVDAAERADPSFELTDETLEPLASILRLTGGLPLAIILAAAWVDMLPVDEIAREIEKNLDFLETEMGDVPDRHRSIRAVFDYSWALLSDAERETFTALSVFRGGFAREAAQNVADASLRAIANLAAKSLISSDPSTGRYVTHELLRQYAEAQLESDPVRCDEVKSAHAGYFADVMQDALALFPVSEQVRMVKMVEDDIDNIRAAWHHYCGARDGVGVQRMMTTLYFVHELRGWYPAGIASFDEVLGAFAEAVDDESVIAREMSRVARSAFVTLRGSPGLGAAEATVAMDSLPESTSAADRWIAVQCVAISMAYGGDVENMIATLDEAFDTYSGLDEQLWVSGIKNWRSFGAALAGDFETVDRLTAEALTVYESKDEHYFMVWALWLRGMLAVAGGRYEEAVEMYTRQVDRATSIGYTRGLAVAYEGLGEANEAAGLLDEAESAFIRSVRAAEQMGMAPDMLNLMMKTARVRAAMNRDTDAVELLAAVCANPISEKQPFTELVPIRENAASILDEVRSRIDSGVYDDALARGECAAFDSVLNELLGRGTESTSLPV
ncbi:MAG: tetratricopeptide repeat protein, partial [Actinomycetia bacterium]|nr:tetratricopeptide repeat protein [Actinomycetes bacterium]